MPQPTKTASEIITLFELQVDDTTNLSSDEELSVLNRVYQRVLNSKPWEFLKTNASGSLSQDSDGYYITIPTDFGFFLENTLQTDNTETIYNNASPKVIFIGTNYDPYQIVNWSDRRQYRNRTGYAYYDRPNGKIRILGTPTSTTYDFDYTKIAPLLTISDTPLCPGQFHDMFAYAMAVENDILERSEKARSYAAENQARFIQDLNQMHYWNAQQMLS